MGDEYFFFQAEDGIRDLVRSRGLGIYVGRFLRFHSVHIINHPFSVIVSTLKSLNLEALIFVSFIILIQALLFLFVKGVRSRT
ncbi:DUF1361 domain-containing protein [Streptococcus suis]